MMLRRKRQTRRVRCVLFGVFVLVIVGVSSCMKVQEHRINSRQAVGAPMKAEQVGSLAVETAVGGVVRDEVISGWDEYPDELVEMYEKYPETLPFILGYPEAKKSGKTKHSAAQDLDLSGECRKGKIPLWFQWDKRWGYGPYGDSMLGVSGCGPTCLSMVVVGLTGNTRWHPSQVAAFSESNGFLVPEVGTDWRLFSTGAEQLGLQVRRLVLQGEELWRELMAGHPVICSMKPGDFTYTGHFIVLTGVDRDGKIKVNDPNSPKNSACMWPLKTILQQSKAAWAYGCKGRRW